MLAADIIESLSPLLGAFRKIGITYQIGGSVASGILGEPRATVDVDLVANITPEHAAQLEKELKDIYYVDAESIRRAARERQSFNVLNLKSMMKIDVFVVKDDPYSRQSFTRYFLFKQRGDAGISLNIETPEDCVLHKIQWYQKGGCVSDRQWRDVLGILKHQNSALDVSYLFHWSDRLQLRSLLDRALSEAGYVDGAWESPPLPPGFEDRLKHS